MTTGAGPRVAFYAPMKPPHHPVPSGDREMARNLMRIIAADGAEVSLVSELQTRDRSGDTAIQAQLTTAAEAEIARLLHDMPDCALWVTYHNYYKAPDLVGPAVAKARGIPYIQIESTRAKSRLNGPWAAFAHAAHAAADAADATEGDRHEGHGRDGVASVSVAALRDVRDGDDGGRDLHAAPHSMFRVTSPL